jgi:hypothetical protein
MKTMYLTLFLLLSLLLIGCTTPAQNGNTSSNGNNLVNVNASSTPLQNTNTDNRGQSNTSVQSERVAGAWLAINNSNYMKVDLENVARIDFTQSGAATRARLRIVQGNRLVDLINQEVSDERTIQRLRSHIQDNSGRWARVREQSGSGDNFDFWVNLNKVNYVSYAEAQDGPSYQLGTDYQVTIGQVHIPAEMNKVRAYLGIP